MKNPTSIPSILACCAVLAFAAPAIAADAPKPGAPAADPAEAALMAEMMKAAQPGPEHAVLASMSGTWKATISMWSGPGDPQKSEGTMVNTMQLGGRALEGRFKGTFMGAPMEGVGFTGFDNMKKEWWSFWVDTMSTASLVQTGPAAADARTIVVHGMSVGPDGKPADFVSTTKFVDADTHVFSMGTKAGDQVTPVLEITYNRVK